MNKLIPESSKVYNKILNGFNEVVNKTNNEMNHYKENYEPLLQSNNIYI